MKDKTAVLPLDLTINPGLNESYTVLDKNGNFYAKCYSSYDARLIAAAPDMLSVLNEAVRYDVVYKTNPALLELFRAVIAKADGSKEV